MLGAMRDGVIPRQPLPVRRDDEIGALAGAFNGLLQGLIEGEARAAEHSFNQRLRVIVSQIPGVVFQYRIGADGRHSLPFVSDAAREVWGLAPDGLAEASDGFLVTLEGEDRAAFLARVREERDQRVIKEPPKAEQPAQDGLRNPRQQPAARSAVNADSQTRFLRPLGVSHVDHVSYG